MSRLFLLFYLCTFGSSAIPEEGLDYSERVEIFASDSGPIEVINRNVIFENSVSSNSVGYSHFLASKNGQVMSASGSIHGLVNQGTNGVRYDVGFSGPNISNIQKILDYHTFSAWVGQDPHFMTFKMTLSMPGGFEITLPSKELYGESLSRMQIFHIQSAARARAWSQFNDKQRQEQQKVADTAQGSIYQFREQNERDVALGLGQTMLLQEAQESLSQAIDDLKLNNSIHALNGQLLSLRHSPLRQQKMQDSLEVLVESQSKQAGVVNSDIFSPLLSNPSKKIQNDLISRGVRNGVLPGPIIGNQSIRFQDPRLEDRRLRLQNEIQMMGNSSRVYMTGQGKNGVRTIQTRLKNAEKFEGQGKADSANEKMKQAEDILREGLSHKGWKRENYVEALHELYDHPTHSQNFKSKDEEFLKTAEPLAGVFESVLAENTNLSGPEAVEKAIAAEHGLEFLNQADEASQLGQNSTADFYTELAIGTTDIITGFIAPISFVKDSYEALSGRHWLTGNELSTLERSLAIGGVLTLGVGSGVMKVLGKSLFLVEKTMATTLLRQGKRLSGAFQRASVRSHQAVGEVLKKIKTSSPAIKSFKDAEHAILNTGKSIHTKMQNLGFPTRTIELIPTNQLNREVLKKPGWKEYAIPDRWAFRVESLRHPEQLVRAHVEGSQVSKWFVHRELMDDLAKNTNNFDDFAKQLKTQLNVRDVPTHFSTLKVGKHPYRMTVSEIKKIEGWGQGQGQLQFFIENPLKKSNFNPPKTLKEFFEASKAQP